MMRLLTIVQLKALQEVNTYLMFLTFALVFFRTESLKWNHAAGFLCLVLAVYFIFRK